MQFGDKGSDVTELQDYLIKHNFLDAKENYYGVKTMEAVRNLQSALDLETTGIFDESLYSLYDLKLYADSHTMNTRAPVMDNINGDETILDYSGMTGNILNNIGSNYSKDTTVTTSNATSSNVSIKEYINTTSSDNASYQQSFNESDADLSGLQFPAYIQNLITGTTIKIPVTIEEINWSKSNNFAEVETKGRSASYLGYSNSSAKTLDFSFIIHKDLLTDNETLESYCNKLEALAYPRYGDYTVPPKAFFRCGTIRLEGVVNEVSVSLSPPIIDGAYSVANVSISMTETYDIGMSATTIEAGEK